MKCFNKGCSNEAISCYITKCSECTYGVQLSAPPEHVLKQCLTDGCSTALPLDSHTNLKYCAECRTARDREAAARCRKPGAARTALLQGYGLTVEQYDELWEAQEGCCAICGTHEDDLLGGRLHIDHCHITGHLRGLLCYRCNPGLGHFKDDIVLLQAAIAYLSKPVLCVGGVRTLG